MALPVQGLLVWLWEVVMTSVILPLRGLVLLAFRFVAKPIYQPCPPVAGDSSLKTQKHLNLFPICLGC